MSDKKAEIKMQAGRMSLVETTELPGIDAPEMTYDPSYMKDGIVVMARGDAKTAIQSAQLLATGMGMEVHVRNVTVRP